MPITKFNLMWHVVTVERLEADQNAWRRFLARCKRDYIHFKRGMVITPHESALENVKAWLPRGAKMYVVDVTDYQIEHSHRFFGEA